MSFTEKYLQGETGRRLSPRAERRIVTFTVAAAIGANLLAAATTDYDEQVCKATKEVLQADAAVATRLVTGSWPEWAPPEFDPTSHRAMEELMMAGAQVSLTPPAQCLPKAWPL